MKTGAGQSIHAAHTAARHGGVGRSRGRGIFRLIRDKALGGKDHGRHAGRVLQRRTGDLGRVNDTGLNHVAVYFFLGIKAIVGIAAGHNFVDNDTALQAGIGRDLAQRSPYCSLGTTQIFTG